jgi:hypothetical protein
MTAHLTARGSVAIPLVFVLENLRMNEYILGGGELATGMSLSLLVCERLFGASDVPGPSAAKSILTVLLDFD